MADRVVVRVPATVANLGPGFDCLGMAVAWHNEVRIERGGKGELTVTATGPGAGSMPTDDSNLVVRGLVASGLEARGLVVSQMIAIAPGRGFGSSAAAICAGLVGGAALQGAGEDLLDRAIALEGHADNVAPCLRGGITVTGGGRTLRLEPPEDLVPMLCVAPSKLSTEVARAALGATIDRSTAAATIGRAALLAASLASGDHGALFDATDDGFHQPQRFALMPDTGELVASLRGGGVAAFLSGAGPSVAALVPRAQAPAALSLAQAAAPEGWTVKLEEFDRTGARVVDLR